MNNNNNNLSSIGVSTLTTAIAGVPDNRPSPQLVQQIVQTITVTIEDAQSMESAYIRTRHNNIRCFPRCGKVHKTKSFCGTPLFVTIQSSMMPLNVKDVAVIGEFRTVRKAPAFMVNAACPSKLREQPAFLQGHVTECNGKMRFTINPPRKWRYRARIAQVLDMHVFTVYVSWRDVVVAVRDTPQFQVIPIWKADDNLLRFNDGEEEGEEEEDDINNNSEADEPGAVVEPAPTTFKRMKSFENEASSSVFNTSSSLAGLPRYSPRVLANLRLGESSSLPPPPRPYHPMMAPSFPMVHSSYYTGQYPSSSLTGMSASTNQQYPLVDQRYPSPTMTPVSSSSLNQYDVGPIPPTYASATGQPMHGGMHVGPEAFGHMQFHNMGGSNNNNTLQNKFLTNMLSNAYRTNEAFATYNQQYVPTAAASAYSSSSSSSAMQQQQRQQQPRLVHLTNGKNTKDKHQD